MYYVFDINIYFFMVDQARWTSSPFHPDQSYPANKYRLKVYLEYLRI